ncbi:MAG: thymidine phosphorylase [Chloroflexi bacterium]|nr:thymidine phosphorylase [Chloroflexota bacterium]
MTGTVPSIPLIASSIMSKKIAGGAQAIVLDVKVGNGAFMETLEMARELSDLMVKIGDLAGRKTICLLSDMNQPLGHAVGNALEVKEAIEALKDGGPADFREHCLHVSAHMLVVGKRAKDLSEGRKMAETALANGSAFEKFRVLVQAQGGDVSYVDRPDKMARAKFVEVVNAPRSGILSQVEARSVGEASVTLGAGRAKKSDAVDHAVGFIIHHKVGDKIQKGEPLFTIHANDEKKLAEARERVTAAHVIGDKIVPPFPLFYE